MATDGSDFYPYSGAVPSLGTPRDPAEIVAEFNAILAGFGKILELTGNANKIVLVNAGETSYAGITGANGVLVTSAGSVPSISSAIPSATQDNITRTGVVTVGTWSAVIGAATQDSITRTGTVTSGTWNSSLGTAAQANKTAIKAESNQNTYVPPDLVRHSPGVSKAYCRITAVGALVANSYNVASVTDTATGNRTVVIDDDFANANYAPASSLAENPGGSETVIHDTFAVGSFRLLTRDGVSLADFATSTIVCGGQ